MNYGKRLKIMVLAALLCVFAISTAHRAAWSIDPALAMQKPINCVPWSDIENENVKMSDEAKALAVDAAANFSLGWPKRTSNRITYNKTAGEAVRYIHMVYVEQAFLDIFMMDDGSIVAELRPWDGKYEYPVKNPEVLQPFTEQLLLENAS